MVILSSYAELDFRNEIPDLSSTLRESRSSMPWTFSSILFWDSCKEDARVQASWTFEHKSFSLISVSALSSFLMESQKTFKISNGHEMTSKAIISLPISASVVPEGLRT